MSRSEFWVLRLHTWIPRYFAWRYAQAIAYLLIVVMGIVGFTVIQHQASELAKTNAARRAERIETTNELCEQAKSTHNVLVDIINSSSDFYLTVIPKNAPSSPELEAFKLSVETNRKAQLKDLDPVTCKIQKP